MFCGKVKERKSVKKKVRKERIEVKRSKTTAIFVYKHTWRPTETNEQSLCVYACQLTQEKVNTITKKSAPCAT